jgi:hypothetical protein
MVWSFPRKVGSTDPFCCSCYEAFLLSILKNCTTFVSTVGEHWGAPDPNDPFHTILPMNETEWYQKDLFGLKTAQEAGKNYFESFDGDHLQFTMEDFDGWVNKYLVAKETSQVAATTTVE